MRVKTEIGCSMATTVNHKFQPFSTVPIVNEAILVCQCNSHAKPVPEAANPKRLEQPGSGGLIEFNILIIITSRFGNAG
jgi:hypothetical protein